MKKCLSCGNSNKESGLFCESCGAKLPQGYPVCSNCKSALKEGAKFCAVCGVKIADESMHHNHPACPHCGKEIQDKEKFCKYCGRSISGQPSAKVIPAPSLPKSFMKPGKLKLAIIAAGVGLLLLIAIIVPVALHSAGRPPTRDLGVATVKDPEPEMMIESEVLGLVPANQVGVILAEGFNRTDAQNIADELGASIVGEIEFINFYQLETKDSTEGELIASLDKASKLEGVKLAFPNSAIFPQSIVEGKSCSPLNDPLYTEGSNSRPYKMIGVQNAWDIIKASGVKLNKVRVGIIDSAIYTKSDNGFSPELYFPDKIGKYPKGKVQIVPLDADKDLTNAAKTNPQTGGLVAGGLSHGTEMAHIVGADPTSGGAAGVAGILGGDMSIVVTNTYNISAISTPTPALDIDATDITQYKGNTYSLLVDLKKQVENNVKVINLSVGPAKPGAGHAAECQAYKLFFEKMNSDYPDVVFVAAAGNENGGLDGANYGPGGISAPNVITVGALDQDGDRAKVDDWYKEENLQKWYQKGLADGSISNNMTYQAYKDSRASGSNYATGNGEVTLSAVGTGVPVGIDPNGKSLISDGTSVAAPQVTGAIALMQSINPKLTAEQIKKILNETKASEVERDGNKVAVPANVGGGILRVDDAVLKVINNMRKDKDKNAKDLKKEDLLAMFAVKLIASGGPKEYIITASINPAGAAGTAIRIETSGEGFLEGSATQKINARGEVSWKLAKESDNYTIRVFRSDTEACAFLNLGKNEGFPKIEELVGDWIGSWEVVDFVKTNEQLLDPLLIEILEALKGIKFDLKIQMVQIDDTRLQTNIEIQDLDSEDDLTFDSHQTEMTYKDGNITANYETEDGQYVFSGSASYVENGIKIEGYWNAVKDNNSMQSIWEAVKMKQSE